MALLSRCFVCAAGFAAETARPYTQPNEKYAFDPARGRLWIVCSGCGSWNLVPIEARWEAIEDLEKLARDRGRLLARTDNVALIEADRTTLIRIGRTERREEAWWRYLKEAELRRENARRIVRRGRWKDAFLNLLILGLPIPAGTDPDEWLNRARVLQFTNTLWTGAAVCSECGGRSTRITFEDPLTVVSRGDDLCVRSDCPACGAAGRSAVVEVVGPAATRVLQRKLAYTNYAGATENSLNVAVDILDHAPDARTFVRTTFASPVPFSHLMSGQLVAFEMAVNEAREADLLSMEVRALEARWREEEEIAFIVDRELTP